MKQNPKFGYISVAKRRFLKHFKLRPRSMKVDRKSNLNRLCQIHVQTYLRLLFITSFPIRNKFKAMYNFDQRKKPFSISYEAAEFADIAFSPHRQFAKNCSQAKPSRSVLVEVALRQNGGCNESPDVQHDAHPG